jgi:hypothetical protein
LEVEVIPNVYPCCIQSASLKPSLIHSWSPSQQPCLLHTSIFPSLPFLSTHHVPCFRRNYCCRSIPLWYVLILRILPQLQTSSLGDVWDLQSSVSDAKEVKHWLVDHLNVPKHNVVTLFNEQATLHSIQTALHSHLLNNHNIEKGDAMLIYFAGHGSSVKTPDDWIEDGVVDATARVEVLCPFDHETRTNDGRVAGISARAMHAFLRQLSSRKGNNTTLIIDSSFTPSQSRDRGRTRWTSSNKVVPEDLYNGPFAAKRCQKSHESFYDNNSSHAFIAASRAGSTAVEGKEGGRYGASNSLSANNFLME